MAPASAPRAGMALEWLGLALAAAVLNGLSVLAAKPSTDRLGPPLMGLGAEQVGLIYLGHLGRFQVAFENGTQVADEKHRTSPQRLGGTAQSFSCGRMAAVTSSSISSSGSCSTVSKIVRPTRPVAISRRAISRSEARLLGLKKFLSACSTRAGG